MSLLTWSAAIFQSPNGNLISQHDYDLLDRRQSEIRYLSSTSKTETAYAFDIADQLQQMSHSDTAGALLAQFDYPSYDPVGNRVGTGYLVIVKESLSRLDFAN